MTERTGPLSDLTIIDCTMAYAGPFGTVMLADLGADVIKIEPPNGDTFRPVPPFPEDYEHAFRHSETGADYGMPFAAVNRNKRSVALNLKDPDDREVFLLLCEQADAVVENMRAGVMDELGLGYEIIAKRNPRIVYGTVRGFGDPRTGASPYVDWPSLDPAGQAFGGLVEATGGLYELAISDMYPGTLMAFGLLAAIHQARATGRGDFFDVAMLDGSLTLLKSNVASHSLTGNDPRPGNRTLVPFSVFPTSDGQVAIAAPVDHHWKALCAAMEREDLITDERTRNNAMRAKNHAFTEAQVAAWTSARTKSEIVAAIGGKVPCGPAHTLTELLADPHTQARGIMETAQLPGNNPEVTLMGTPVRFASGNTGLYQAPPRLGEHTDEVLSEFGVTRQSKD